MKMCSLLRMMYSEIVAICLNTIIAEIEIEIANKITIFLPLRANKMAELRLCDVL